jgi:phage shock protein PspC (stress-responsive transcriptional regulator)
MGADPTVVRLIAVAILVISCGAAILAYLAAWIIMPVDYSGVPNPAPSAGNWT